jgi:hypothetical protein
MTKFRWAFNKCWYEQPDAPSLEENEIVDLAEIEAVLFPIALVMKWVQTDDFAANSYSFLFIWHCFVSYAVEHNWHVADVDKKRNTTSANHWFANAKYPQRDYSGNPIGIAKMGFNNVKMIKKGVKDLKPRAQKLIGRLEVEFMKYGAKPHINQLMAMVCNPLTADLSFEELECQSKLLKSKTKTKNKEALKYAADFRVEAKLQVIHALSDICSELVKEAEAEEVPTPSDSSSEEDAL